MSLFTVIDIAGSGMSAESVRLNSTASNIANAETVTGSAASAYKAKHAVFQAVLEDNMAVANGKRKPGVQVLGIAESNAETPKLYNPSHPLADKDGYVYSSNVNMMEEMADMISASRAYQSNIEILQTAKELMQRTLALGE